MSGEGSGPKNPIVLDILLYEDREGRLSYRASDGKSTYHEMDTTFSAETVGMDLAGLIRGLRKKRDAVAKKENPSDSK